MNLESNQRSAVEKLSKLRAGALFMKMGSGKTKVACDLVRLRLGNIDAVIWIVPASLLKSARYLSEIEKWSAGFFGLIFFFSTESVSQSDSKYLEMRKIAESRRVFCIVDESIFIKNTKALRTRRLLGDYHLFDFRIILNGTPITKSLLDLYAQISFLSPNILKMTERQFADNFLVYFFDGIDPFPWRRWSKPANVEALAEIIKPYVFDADFDNECRIRVYNREFDLDSAERRRYSDFKRKYLNGKFYVCFFSVAQAFQHAYTVSCKAKFCAAIEIVNRILDRGEKVVIFAKFVAEAQMLNRTFGGLVYMGGRKDDLSLFETEESVLVCTYGVGSMGLNLQCANNVVFYSQTFDYKEKEQATHRIFRTGQTKTVNVYNLWINTGLEDIIKYSLDRKRDLLEMFERVITAQKAQKL